MSKQKIAGIIIPSNWDVNGRIKGVSLHTFDEKEYLVQPGRLSNELLNHVHHMVEASGKIHLRPDGRRQIILSHYRKKSEPFEV